MVINTAQKMKLRQKKKKNQVPEEEEANVGGKKKKKKASQHLHRNFHNIFDQVIKYETYEQSWPV